MDISINIAPTVDSWKVVKRAEELGYTSAWFYDTQMQNTDLFVAMTAAALNTSRIRLGTGVLIPSNRIAPVAATALGSLNALAPGRIDFGVSTGFTGRRAMGSGPIKLADMKEYIRVVQALLRGEMVEWEFEGRRRKIKYLNPEIGAINLDDPIPLHISAFGPKGQALTAELGANWIMAPANLQFAEGAIAKMKQTYRDAGQDPATKYITSLSGGAVLHEGEPYDSPRAKAQAGPHAAMIFHNLVEAAEFGDIGRPVPPHLKPLYDRYREIYLKYEPADARYISNHRGHLMFLRPEEQALINGDIIKATTWTGTKPELIERMRGLRDLGYSAYSVHIRNGHPDMLEDWAEVFAGI
jgi:alkanesulfonate monooxygenase SsuD/methylene tetrahydromethanopterin reductase-like flavin-dependent oxidoreductase (luciferase family)